MWAGKKSQCFFALQNDFNTTEKIFIIRNIKKHLGKDLDESDLNAISLEWLLEFLQSIQHSFSMIGFMLNHCIISKIKIQTQ